MIFNEITQNDDRRFFGGGGAALTAVRKALSGAATVRIATAFFETSGWECLRDILPGKEVRLLVGRPEKGEDKIRDVIDEFLQSVNTGPYEERMRIVMMIREAIVRGEFVVSIASDDAVTTLDPRYLHHHAKLYIADTLQAVVTSANFTKNGLVYSREAGITVTNRDDVAFFAERFDYYFNQGVRIANLLLERIDEWLSLYSPYEIYMLSLLSLYGMPDDDTPAHLPELAGYQRPVVSRVLRNINEYGGSLLVASTGLGKTVMAAHVVAHLAAASGINAAIVLCPSGLKSMWRRTMRAARISSIEFSYYVLSVDDWRRVRDVSVLDRELKNADSSTIVILDESHHLRNVLQGSQTGLRYSRLAGVINRDARILLMTATPYSKGVDDINAQLMILPGYSVEDGLFHENVRKKWELSTPSELSELKCGVVLTTPSVVRHFSTLDENGDRYVLFSGDKRRYFPHRIHIENIQYNNLIDDSLSYLLKSGLLNVMQDDEENDQGALFGQSGGEKRRPLFEALLVHRFCSSLRESDVVLEKLSLEKGFDKIRFARQKELSKTVEKIRTGIRPYLLQNDVHYSDEKMDKLTDIIRRFPEERVVIFCVYIETAEYIVECIKNRLPGIRVQTTVRKNPDELESIIRGFSPVANSIDIDDGESSVPDSEQIDVLVATSAMAEGFNFQDASVLVNYDLPWTVLLLAQRMGRILRPWQTPRDIYIFTMMPSTMKHPGISHAMNWNRRLHRRNEDFSSFADIPVMVEKSEQYEMFDLARTMNSFGKVDLDFNEVYRFIENADKLRTSSFIDDLAMADDATCSKLRRLPDGIRSCKCCPAVDAALYLLIRYKNGYYPALFDKKGNLVMDHERMDDIMRLLRSAPDEKTAESSLGIDDQDLLYSRAVRNWAVEKNVAGDDVTVRCMMLLA